MSSALERFIKKKNKQLTYQQTTNSNLLKKQKKNYTKALLNDNKNNYYKKQSSLPSLKIKKRSQSIRLPQIMLKHLPQFKKTKTISIEKLIQKGRNTPIRLLRNNSSLSSKGMGSTGCKPTDKYIDEINKIKFVQKLLLAKPSQNISISNHFKFYKKQKQYKNNIRINKSLPLNRKFHYNQNKWL